jgi:hypothetical protein
MDAIIFLPLQLISALAHIIRKIGRKIDSADCAVL